MYKHTSKKYDQLPEIKKRKDAEQKRKELMDRKEKVKQLNQV